MPLHIIERNFVEQFNEDEYCLYEARIPRRSKAATRLGIPADGIVEVDQYVPSTA